jgi:hypothetical protein
MSRSSPNPAVSKARIFDDRLQRRHVVFGEFVKHCIKGFEESFAVSPKRVHSYDNDAVFTKIGLLPVVKMVDEKFIALFISILSRSAF